MRHRDFHEELEFFLNKIKRNEHFSLSRWGDGELMILENQFIDLRNVKNGEFRYDPNLPEYDTSWKKLMDAYTYHDKDYHIGVACPCCVGDEKYQYMKNLSRQGEDNLTWANIFVNSNYYSFMDKYIPEFQKHDIIMVVNKQADSSKLPFNIKETYKVGTDAWFEDLDLINYLQLEISKSNIENTIFLIAAGPLANILTYELWKFSKKNTYIDIGSVFDVQMGMKPTRGYHMGAPTLKKKCIW